MTIRSLLSLVIGGGVKTPAMEKEMEKPEGLRLLEGPQQTEADTKSCLAQCCSNNPICEFEKECQKLYDRRATADTRCGGWGFSSRGLDKREVNPYITDTQRYAETIPVLRTGFMGGIKEQRILRLG